MKVLIASKDEQGAWKRVAIIRCGSKVGSYNLPVCCQGQLAGEAAKAGINYLRGEQAASEVFCTLGRVEFRVHRIQEAH